MEMHYSDPRSLRVAIRSGKFDGQTSGQARGYAQANLAILPAEFAEDFRRFCELNPKPCPVLEITAPGDPVPHKLAPDADLRHDIPRYRVYRDGELVAETTDIANWWRDDLVAFLIGCSFTFETGLLAAGVPVRHIELGRNVPMYRTWIETTPYGIFHGPLVVSMRPVPPDLVEKAREVTARYPQMHGAPVQIGHPEELGIVDITQPDYGEAVPIYEGEVPIFWACGVTPQSVALASKLPFMITHAPGHMFVSDLTDEQVLNRQIDMLAVGTSG